MSPTEATSKFFHRAADLLELSERERKQLLTPFREITLTARGGGTGTNGQSLTAGLIVDLGRHMTRIGGRDGDRVEVEPGVVLDQLNAHLAPQGVFFAPNLSPSSRATIGGMIATDASGQGSRVYGKTSQHVAAIEVVLVDRKDLPSAGAGETPIVAVAPAIAGAIFAATGQRLRAMPLVPDGMPKPKA